MTKYYIDSDNGLDTNAGTSTGAAYKTMNKFTETARTAGDIGICRRGTTATYDDGGGLDFTSDGTYTAPLVLEADFDDDFGDFANSTQTYTPVFGSKTMTASATITGISVGAWVYNSTDGDDPREFSYEVAAVSGTTLTLFLPWKGSTGATKTLKVMPAAPVWGSTTSFAFDLNFLVDNFWILQGIEWRSSTTASIFDCLANLSLLIKDCIAKGVSTTEIFDNGASGSGDLLVAKTRCLTYSSLLINQIGTSWKFKDCLFDGNSSTPNVELSGQYGYVFWEECEFIGHTTADIRGGAQERGATRYLRNCSLNSATQFSALGNKAGGSSILFIEDHDGALGATWQHSGRSVSNTVPFMQSDTSTLRSGGGNVSILITPSIHVGTSEPGRFLIFEYPIYATTSSKTYTVYFKSNATTDWTANPTAAECWLELEAWGHASNNFRKITKSTGALDFTTDALFDQTLAVTVAPAQAGVAYLRLYYGKPKESGKANKFYIDPKVVIS